jgi:ATP-dependent Lon protease
VETVKALPTKTSRFPDLDKDYLEYAQEYWKEQVSGLEDIYEKLLLHIVQYLRTGRTRPIIMVGAPGCGKTKVMLTLGEILEMPVHFANAVQMAKGNGLSGTPKTYVSSAPGEPVEAMVRHRRGNLIFAIDEIDKAAMYAGRGGDLQDELLNLTSDETAKYHKDNFLGFTVNTSHLFIIMTANDLDHISEPLKSRCDVIEFPEPTQEMIADIMVKHTVPKMLDTLKCRENVRVVDGALSEMVVTLFSSGLRDIRKYQSITENVINSAFLKSLLTASVVEVTFEELTRAADKQLNKGKRCIGF